MPMGPPKRRTGTTGPVSRHRFGRRRRIPPLSRFLGECVVSVVMRNRYVSCAANQADLTPALPNRDRRMPPENRFGLFAISARFVMEHHAPREAERRPAALDAVDNDPVGRIARMGKQRVYGHIAKPALGRLEKFRQCFRPMDQRHRSTGAGSWRPESETIGPTIRLPPDGRRAWCRYLAAGWPLAGSMADWPRRDRSSREPAPVLRAM